MKQSWLKVDIWLFAVLVFFTIFAWANWGKIQFPIIDIGHEVVTPPRLLAGEVLYRDVDSYYAPLSYYLNALFILIFGYHLEVFYAIGLFLSLVATLLFYSLAKKLMNSQWAFLCTIYMLAYCAIGPSITNFIVPYSYGAVYAIVLSLLAFTFIDQYAHKGQTLWLVAAAIACGLAGLSKQEYGVALLGSVLVGTNIYASHDQNIKTQFWRSLLVILVSGASFILPLTILICQQVSWEQLKQSLLPLSKSQILIDSGMFGFTPARTINIWWRGLKNFLGAFPVILGVVILSNWLSKLIKLKFYRQFKTLFELLFSIVISVVCLFWINYLAFFKYYTFTEFIQPISDLSWSIPLILCWFLLNRQKISHIRNASLLLSLLIFSLLINSRWLFHIYFYGLFAISVVLLFFALIFYITQRSRRILWSSLLVCILIASGLKLWNLTPYRYAVTSNFGTFYTEDIALADAFNKTINTLNTSYASSVLILPHGNILNFLTRTHSPSKETNFIPGVIPTAKDEQNFILDMEKQSLDLIVYVDVPFYSLNPGYRTFAEINPLIHKWIITEHQLVKTFSINSKFPWNNGIIKIFTPFK
ncbi:MAG: glycosyltransferase family 39 protein [Nostoc sp. TH1S01]|nr:glycosyltransferase family 39 protein [Nostoc sp. TH1S01]